ncbi:NADPH-dependent F420 reductase [Occultella gossypii]|uniref:NAD(P)-binding domain-containing protein n=1 Tax=Occultella gossypii TaxID=2800820 RepID=A0ABS7SBA0_9MICO|nr:NAD(P)-binding domain-containing protein [Occultella gossypii]MBZ2197641.1 NAD(P)-binding domain-containing protein [Occultella gossypii]
MSDPAQSADHPDDDGHRVPTGADGDVGTVAILGAGRVGTAIARVAMRAGYQVRLAASGDPALIDLIAQIMAPGAVTTTAADAVTPAELVVLALPLGKHATLDGDALAGKVVVDAMNYWPSTDGRNPELEAAPSTSEVVARHLTRSAVVKTLNHIGYHDLEEHGLPAGAPGRRALGVAGDDPDATALVRGFVDRLGFDPVDAGDLAAGVHLQPGTPIFNGSHDATALSTLLREAPAAVGH